jgi:hypothetical protein
MRRWIAKYRFRRARREILPSVHFLSFDSIGAAAKLAPVPAPPLAAAADKIPLDQLKVPKGFNLELYASGMPNARSLALGSKGTVFVGSRLQDKVYAITNKNGKHEAKPRIGPLSPEWFPAGKRESRKSFGLPIALAESVS